MTTRNRRSAIIFSASLLTALVALSGCNKSETPPATTAAAPATLQTPPYTPPTAQELTQMVAPIALFPDKLVAQVLAGSTYPDQIVAANQWLGQNTALKGAVLQAAEEKQPWDVSVKSLTTFPAVLSQMAVNSEWTRSLGDAFVNDPSDVMNAIQALRLRAQQAGTLRSASQLKVSTSVRSTELAHAGNKPELRPVYAGEPVIPPPPQTILIESSLPDTVYVPVYNPAVVYGPSVPAYPGYVYRPSSVATGVVVGALSFGAGVFVGEAISQHADWSWHAWGMNWGGSADHDRPASDWQRPAVLYKNTTYVSHSTTVINRVPNNPTVNNTRITNNNVDNHINNINKVNNFTTNNNEPRIDNRREQSAVNPALMSIPHFTASDERPGAASSVHAEAQQKMALAHEHPQQEDVNESPKQNDPRQRMEAGKANAGRRIDAQQAKTQAEERKTVVQRPESVKQEAPQNERKEVAPLRAHANESTPRPEKTASRLENNPDHERKPAMEKHEVTAREHETERPSSQRHEAAEHEGEKHGVEKYNVRSAASL